MKTEDMQYINAAWEKIGDLVKAHGEAETVKRNAETRGEMIFINIHNKIPYYNSARYYVSLKTKRDSPTWFGVREQ